MPKPVITQVGPYLKKNGSSTVCVKGSHISVDDCVEITQGSEVWRGKVIKAVSGGYYLARVRRNGNCMDDYPANDSDDDEVQKTLLTEPDLGAISVTVTQTATNGGQTSDPVSDVAAYDP